MNPLSRESFVKQFAAGIDLKTLDADARAALGRAGIGENQLNAAAGHDGVISKPKELERLFALIDRVDHNGHYGSIDTTQDGPRGKQVTTLAGGAYQALKRELDDQRTAAHLGGHAVGQRGSVAAHAAEPPKFLVKENDAPWIKTAGPEVNIREGKAEAVNPRILEYFSATWEKHTDDSGKKNAWCAAFVTWSLKEAGVNSHQIVGARGYEKFGEPCEPFRGAIAILQHGKQKHVAFIAGVDKNGHIVFLGGNQDGKVSAVTLPNCKVIAIRKPAGYEIPAEMKNLPVLDVKSGKEIT
jgi:uncharacterized protein (TIGR02594 family)